MATNVKIFIDFWSLQLTWNDWHAARGARDTVKIPWTPRLPEVLVRRVDSSAVYAGTHVYASHAPGQGRDSGLRRFFAAMEGFRGYDLFLKERATRSPANCTNPQCRQPVNVCPHCRQAIRRTVEKGVDTALATDLIRFGIDGHYDRAVLVAADADHIPAVRFLSGRGKRVTHAWFRGSAVELRNACWEHVHFEDLMGDLLAA